MLSVWHLLEIMQPMMMPFSVSMFALAMNMIAKSVGVECRGPQSHSGTQHPLIRAYMDDLRVMTLVPRCRWLLHRLKWLTT